MNLEKAIKIAVEAHTGQVDKRSMGYLESSSSESESSSEDEGKKPGNC